jgi:hypothetical protein
MLLAALSYGRMARAYPSRIGVHLRRPGAPSRSGLRDRVEHGDGLRAQPIICTIWCSKAAMNFLPGILSFANTGSASFVGSLSKTLPLSCPFGATRSGKRQQRAAQSESRKSFDSRCDDARSGSVQHPAAKRG